MDGMVLWQNSISKIEDERLCMNCKTCRHWMRTDPKEDSGECRQRLPTVFMNPAINPLTRRPDMVLQTFFPRTASNIWCGQFQADLTSGNLNANRVGPDRIIVGYKAACEVLSGITEKTLRAVEKKYPIPWCRFGDKQKPSIRLSDLLDWHDRFPRYSPQKRRR
jgi:hypothetical protein